MKKALALIIALMTLLLAACGQDAPQPQQETTATIRNEKETVFPTEAAPTQDYDLTPEGYFVKEGTLEDGTQFTSYRNGGPEGPLVRVECVYSDGSYGEENYSEDGKLVRMFYKGSDGTTSEMTCYPSGNMEKEIITYPDGSYEEVHFADNGTVDPETGYMESGTVIYQAYVSADGQVDVIVEKVEPEEDGTWWETQKLEGGGTSKTHYKKDWIPIESITEDPVNGYTIETKYYESGKRKEETWTYTNSTEYSYTTYYENGVTKTSEYIGADGREINYQCNEEGYYTYYYDHDQYGVHEYFAGENNELVKYIENDKAYEGDAITENQRNVFKQMQDMAAEVAYNMINGI